jgi:propionate CoA-transferase
LIGEVLPIAQAARNCGGRVIAQVAELRDQLAPPHQVRVPGVLIDRIVVAEPHQHEQTFAGEFRAEFCTAGDLDSAALPPLAWSIRRVIAGRSCDELLPGDVVNLGIGMPEAIARVAAERGLLQRVTLTVESGPIGGIPSGGLSFGAAVHPQALVDQPAQFDFYDGGGLDFAALGAAQVDRDGNVNVSRFGDRVTGVGGFVNISQNAKRVVFCGTFAAGPIEYQVGDGRLTIRGEGERPKFVRQVEQISFSGRAARDKGQQVLFVTERAVFRLVPEGLELIEVAPGIDLQQHVLARMEFTPLIRDVRPMPLQLFYQDA